MSAPTEAPAVSLFTEVRFGRTSAGAWAAADTSGACDAWSPYVRAGARVTLVGRACAERGPAAIALDPAVRLRPLPYYVGLAGLLRAVLPLLRQMRQAIAESDTVVIRLSGPISWLAVILCKVMRRHYVVDVLGDPAEVVSVGALGAWACRFGPMFAMFTRWAVRGARASRFVTREALQRRYPARPGTASAGISDVRVGPGAFVETGRRRCVGRLHLILVGSQETTYKGHDVLFAAMRQLRDHGIPATAALVGSGRLEDDNRALAHRMGIAEHVEFVGHVAQRDALIARLDSADVFVLPSRTEGLPRALVEAMARALPAVATDVGGNRELLDPEFIIGVDDVEALVDRLTRLYIDAALWERQSERNLATAADYTPDALDERFDRWFGSIPRQTDRSR